MSYGIRSNKAEFRKDRAMGQNKQRVIDGEEKRNCSLCKEWLSLDDFNKARCVVGDKITIRNQSLCRKCQSDYFKRRYKQRKGL